jgi:glycosyltransferase involved in cell wall biosynthesis
MSDSPTTPSGFGNVTRNVCAGLAKLGHSVFILGWQTSGQPRMWQGCMMYPIRLNPLGADILLSYLQRLRPDVLITLADIWWMNFIADPIIKNFMHIARIPWALYFPIDGQKSDGTLPRSWIRMLKSVDIPISMSKYAKRLVEKSGIPCHYIPHGVDEKVFHPPIDKEREKSILGYDGRFVVLSDSRNQIRKMLPRLIDTFVEFAKGKEDVLLHLHCDPADPASRVIDYNYSILNDIKYLRMSEKIRFTANYRVDRGLDLEQLASIYAAADVHLLVSWGEGFGLPTLQAASSGVVPIAPDYSANQELIEDHGILLNVAHFIEDQFGISRAYVDTGHVVQELNRLYENHNQLLEMSDRSTQIAETYSWDQIVREWHDLLIRQVESARTSIQNKSIAQNDTIRLQDDRVHGKAELVNALRNAIPKIPDGSSITLRVARERIGEISLDLLRDASSHGYGISIPTVLPIKDQQIPIKRVLGKVLITEETNEIFLILKQIFPILNAWQRSFALTLKPKNYDILKSGSRSMHNLADDPSVIELVHLAESTLVIGGTFIDWPELPVLCAQLRIPCVGFVSSELQSSIWPDLAMEQDNSVAMFMRCRKVLTDYAFASACCSSAEQLLARSGLTDTGLISRLSALKSNIRSNKFYGNE